MTKHRSHLILAGFFLMAVPLHAANGAKAAAPGPRAQFKSLLEKVSVSPSDQSLRKQVIEAAKKLKPAPAIPEEAERRMARGSAAVAQAQKPADFALAVTEFQQAAQVAPWLGEAYYNLAVAQDKAEDFDGAMSTIELAELALPDDKDVRTLRYGVEFRKENSPAAKARKEQAMMQGLSGALYVNDRFPGLEMQVKIDGAALFLQAKRLKGNVCLCNTEDCSGPVGEVKVCRVASFGGRFADLPKVPGDTQGLHFEVMPDGESVNESNFYGEFKRQR